MPRGPHFGREEAEAEVAAIGEAMTRVGTWGEGRNLDEVEAALVRELRALGGPFVPSSEIKIMARGIAEPGWPQSDPDAWEEMLAAAEDEARADARLVHQAALTSARLQARVDRCWGVRSFAVGYRRMLDGFEFSVYIDPWSSRLARKVERRARPTAVVVKPLDRSS
jgi:hypothetical protein